MPAEQAERPGRWVVPPTQAGERLDQALAALSGGSRRSIRSAIAAGNVWLNGKTCRIASRLLSVGDIIDADTGQPHPDPAVVPLTILYDDGWLLAVDKPRGMASQPARAALGTELCAHETAMMQLSLRSGHRVELALIHRLDRVTSGVLLFARHRDASRGLTRSWQEGEVEKTYLAIVQSDARPQDDIRAAIGPDRLTPGRFRTVERGRPARTLVRRLAAQPDLSLLEVRPLTGRTHQVRVHLASRGWPIVGDSLYGGASSPPGPFLHAWRLVVPHPRDRSRVEIVAPVPDDFASYASGHGLAEGLPDGSGQRPENG